MRRHVYSNAARRVRERKRYRFFCIATTSEHAGEKRNGKSGVRWSLPAGSLSAPLPVRFSGRRASYRGPKTLWPVRAARTVERNIVEGLPGQGERAGLVTLIW